MKIKEHERHIQLFERQFLFDQTIDPVRQTQENLYQSSLPLDNMVESIMIQEGKIQKRSQKIKKTKSMSFTEQLGEAKKIKQKKSKRSFKLEIKKYTLQVITAYCITVGLMYLNSVVYFPFFEAIMIIIITYSLKPFRITNLLILLTVPMAIANYNLGVWILTYPQIIICYFSTYIFTKSTWKSLIWIISTVLYALFGYILLIYVGISLKSQQQLIVIYYIYPWTLLIIKTISGLLNQVIKQSSLYLLQISFFLTGISYGMLLTLPLHSIQFWYLLVLLTLEIINSRYQFSVKLIKYLLGPPQLTTIIQPQSSGYACINSFHLVIFVYLICKLKLNSVRFNYNLQTYVQVWYMPLVIWIFFSTYQLVSLVRLRKWQNIMIVGFKSNSWSQCGLRALGLVLGLWYFYLGLCIPYRIAIQ